MAEDIDEAGVSGPQPGEHVTRGGSDGVAIPDGGPATDAADAEDEFEGVGDGRKKHVSIHTVDGEFYEEGEAYLRHADDAFIVSIDQTFDPDLTRRFEKADVLQVEIGQHHSNCFVTTAVAGDGPTLDLLREFRDDAMATTPLGRALVRIYYTVSPPIAATLERHPDAAATRIVRGFVEGCGSLAARRRTGGPVERTALSTLLTVLYVVGVAIGAVGHLQLRAGERLARIN